MPDPAEPADHPEQADRPGPEYVEFHLTDDDLPPEALKDPMRPPKASTVVHCIHCDEEYDSWRMVYRVRVGYDGRVHGFWECPMEGCDGAGFQFDIFPIDRNYIAEEGMPQGEWVDEHEEDCTCEECAELRAEIEADLAEWEKKRQVDLAAEAAQGEAAKAEPSRSAEDAAQDQARADRRRIAEAFASLREPDDRIPLDDLLPENEELDSYPEKGESALDRAGVDLTPQTMMEIERKLGLQVSLFPTTSPGQASMPQIMPRKPVPLPPNWRELLARQDEERSNSSGAMGEEDIPF